MAEKPFIPLLANRHQVVAASSIGVALVVMGIKYVAYLMTGSVALFSDALESIVNLVTAVAAITRSATTRRNTLPPCSRAR